MGIRGAGLESSETAPRISSAQRDGLAQLADTTLVAQSRVEETAPIGPRDQASYLNQMVLIQTKMSPADLLAACLGIERRAGRVRGELWSSRTLDLDIVKYGDRVVSGPDLVIPHPELSNRAFWQRQLEELLPHAR